MSYWLIKSEPSVYSWDKLSNDKKTIWDGIRNYAARLHLRAMRKNDLVLFYHSNEDLAIIGIAKVSKEAFQDPTTNDENWVAIEIKPVQKLKKPVYLAEIKKEKKLSDMALVKISRLSVQPVAETEWNLVMKMAGENK